MTILALILHLMRGARARFAAAALLATLVPLTGLLLMGLSGWFVTASAAAGLAGAGLVFDFFRPSSIIRLATPARAAARYGERVMGHDTTLRALNDLRLGVYRHLSTLNLPSLLGLRSAQALNRLTADMDAVEGVVIRLVFPLVAAVLALLAAGLAIALLVGWTAALAVLAVYGGAIAAMFALSGAGLASHARAQEQALQDLRRQTAEAMRLRAEWAILGQLDAVAGAVLDASTQLEKARARLDRAEIWAMALLTLAPAAAVFAVLVLPDAASAARLLGAALLAVSLAEAPRALWRGLAERGRAALAASRMTYGAQAAAQDIAAPLRAPSLKPSPILELRQLQVAALGTGSPLFAPVDLQLMAGEWAGLAAPSGAGKSALLFALAGMNVPVAGTITVLGQGLKHWPEDALRAQQTLVPQRPALLAGSIADNLRLAAPDAMAAQMIDALNAVCLWDSLAARQGLDTALGAQGSGLSGGEARRLALARALLRQPALLLLDEPTEGLGSMTAAQVLQGLRNALPQTAVLIASHRREDIIGLAKTLHLVPPKGQ